MSAQRLNTVRSWSVCCLIDFLGASYLLVSTVVVWTVKMFSVDRTEMHLLFENDVHITACSLPRTKKSDVTLTFS